MNMKTDKMNLITNLPYNKFFTFIKNFGTDYLVNEFQSLNSFTRTFDIILNDEHTIMYRLEMNLFFENEIFYIQFDAKLFYKNAYNENFEKNYIFSHYPKFEELFFFLENQINEYLYFCEEEEIDALIIENISSKFSVVSSLNLTEIKKIENQSSVFKKRVDVGIENTSSEITKPQKFFDKADKKQEGVLTEEHFSTKEINNINNIFNSIRDSVKEKVEGHKENNKKECQQTKLKYSSEIDSFLNSLNEARLKELIDESLVNNDYEKFMKYTSVLNANNN